MKSTNHSFLASLLLLSISFPVFAQQDIMASEKLAKESITGRIRNLINDLYVNMI